MTDFGWTKASAGHDARPRGRPKVNPMQLEITHQLDNALFGRKDVEFVLRHEGDSTPARAKVRQLVATEVGAKTEHVVIDHMHSATGIPQTRGAARVYKNADLARKQEREHLLRRNNLWQDKKAGEEGEAAEGA